MSKTFSIRIPSHVRFLLENEIRSLLTDKTILLPVSEQLVINLAEADFLTYAGQNCECIFTLTNFRVITNIVVCQLSYGSRWLHSVTLVALPSPLILPDSPLRFSPIQSKAISFQVFTDNKLFLWEETTQQFLDSEVNMLTLPKKPVSVPAPPASQISSIPLLADQRNTAATPPREPLKIVRELFKDVVFDPVTLCEKIKNNKAITGRDTVLLILALNDIIDIQVSDESG